MVLLFLLSEWKTFFQSWLCEMLSSGPLHHRLVIVLYIRVLSPSSCCGLTLGLFHIPSTPWARSYSLWHQSLLCQCEMYFLSLTLLSSQAHLSACLDISCWASHHQIKPNIAVMDLVIFLSLSSLPIPSEQTSTLPVAQAYNLFQFHCSSHPHSSCNTTWQTIRWYKSV